MYTLFSFCFTSSVRAGRSSNSIPCCSDRGAVNSVHVLVHFFVQRALGVGHIRVQLLVQLLLALLLCGREASSGCVTSTLRASAPCLGRCPTTRTGPTATAISTGCCSSGTSSSSLQGASRSSADIPVPSNGTSSSSHSAFANATSAEAAAGHGPRCAVTSQPSIDAGRAGHGS